LNNNNEGTVYKILIVDDEKDELNALSLTLKYAKQFKSEISIAEDPLIALAKLENEEFDLVLSDFKMPRMNGIEFLIKVKEKYPKIIRMLITACVELEIAKEAINKAAIHTFIEKPWYNDELRLIVHEALKGKDTGEFKSSTEVGDVNEALHVVNNALEKIFNDSLDLRINKRVTLEFTSPVEFNKFFYEIKQNKNININDIHVFVDKYIIELTF